MKNKRANRVVRALGALLLASALLPGLVRAQGDAVTLVALDPATGLLVPVELELARRWDVRLDPGTGAVTAIGARPGTVGPPPLLAFDPSSGALLAVDLVAVRLPGSIDVDPRTGAPTPEGLAPAAARGGPILVGYDPVSGSLAPMRIALERQPGTFALDARVGTLSPPPRGPALVGFDPAAGSLAPVAVSAVRGSGGLTIDPGSGRVSVDGAAAPGGALSLLGVASDGSALVPTDLEVVYRPGLLTIDPGTGAFSFPGEPPAGEGPALTMLGVHSPTGALMRGEVEAARRPGAFTVDLVAGTVEQVVPVSEPDTERVDGFVFGGGLDVRQMLNLQDVLEEGGGVGATGASATELAPGIHGFAEYRWRAFSVGVEAAYSVMDTEIRFPQGLQTGDLTYLEFGGNVKLHVPLEGALSPYATFAILRAQIEGDFELEGLTEQRTHESARGGIGAGFDYRFTPLWGLRVEGLYNTTFEDSDAADHLRWRLAVTYSASEAR
jgi:hypothetical protein